jgi:hypothetical protein
VGPKHLLWVYKKRFVEIEMIASLLFSASLASGTGSPICHLDTDQIEGGHLKFNKPSLGYGLKVTPNGDSFDIEVTNPSKDFFTGILIYVSGADSNKRIGSFSSNADFKLPNRCDGLGSGLHTLTHSNKNKKPLSTKFKWSGSGDNLRVSAIVAVSLGTPMAYTPEWQLLDSVPVPKAPHLQAQIRRHSDCPK